MRAVNAAKPEKMQDGKLESACRNMTSYNSSEELILCANGNINVVVHCVQTGVH